jgi:hypothetical protein
MTVTERRLGLATNERGKLDIFVDVKKWHLTCKIKSE